MHPSIIAADIGGSHISSILLNTKDWKIDEHLICQTKTNSFADKSTIIKAWANNLMQSAGQEPIIKHHQFAIALPGPFDYEKGIFQQHPEGKMGSLVGENFRELLLPYFGKNLKIAFENDAACFGLGEACFGLSKNHQRSIGVTLGTGIGSSFIANQQIIKAHSSIPLGGELYEKPYKESIADDYFSTRWFVKQSAKDLGLKVSGVRVLIEQASETYLHYLFNKFANNLYQFLLPYATRFGATTIVIGGNIARAWPYFGDKLANLFEKEGIMVNPSILNEQAIMLGAAKVFEDTFYK